MWPLLEIAVEAPAESDRDVLSRAVRDAVAARPGLTSWTDRESSQVILGGDSDIQLDEVIESLRDQVGVNVGAPQVAYRETITLAVAVDYTHKKQTDGTGEFARVKITFEPIEPTLGVRFASVVVGGAVPGDYVPGVIKGLESVRENGLFKGFPVTGVKATLTDGGYHDVDSSERTFEIAARAAFLELGGRGAPTLIEPIMRVEVETPGDCLSDVAGDLQNRRGEIVHSDSHGDARKVVALVPLANMLGYTSNLRGMSQGRARFSMQYDHYAPLPDRDADPDNFPPAAAMRA